MIPGNDSLPHALQAPLEISEESGVTARFSARNGTGGCEKLCKRGRAEDDQDVSERIAEDSVLKSRRYGEVAQVEGEGLSVHGSLALVEVKPASFEIDSENPLRWPLEREQHSLLELKAHSPDAGRPPAYPDSLIGRSEGAIFLELDGEAGRGEILERIVLRMGRDGESKHAEGE